MTADSIRSPAAKVMDEAIDLAIEGRSPYPERAAFIDADAPSAGQDIERAAAKVSRLFSSPVTAAPGFSSRNSKRADTTTGACGSHSSHITAANPLLMGRSLLLSSTATVAPAFVHVKAWLRP